MQTGEMIAYFLIGIAVLCVLSSITYRTYVKRVPIKNGKERNSHPAPDKKKKENKKKSLSLSFGKGLPTLLISIGFAFFLIAIVLLVSVQIA
jgi:hypothetical protein